MARSDQGYKQGKASRSGGYGRAGQTLSTYISKARRDEVADLMLRTQKEGILDILGIDPTSDMAVKIREGITEEAEGTRRTKADMEAAIEAERQGRQAFRAGLAENTLREGAETLIAALQSATRARERGGLDEGDWIDDLPTLVIDGASWGEEVTGAPQYQKHVNLCMDNSGSTHMAATGYCSRAMQIVSNALMEVLYGASGEFPGVTWDAFEFNRVAVQHTGRWGRQYREGIARQSLQGVVVRDPLDRDAIETNLSPLMERLYNNEQELGLLNAPRLDIILTDGEWESQEDVDEAATWQRMRGANVTTYVLNVCPETIGDIALPGSFRVIPVECISEDGSGLKRVDREILRQTIMSIVIQEAANL